jgi:hypothetical protein
MKQLAAFHAACLGRHILKEQSDRLLSLCNPHLTRVREYRVLLGSALFDRGSLKVLTFQLVGTLRL